MLFHSFDVLPGLGVDPDQFPFVHKQGEHWTVAPVSMVAGLRVRGCRIALHAGLGISDQHNDLVG